MLLSAVILAGGQSKRMGVDKASICYGGKPLIQAAIDNIRSLTVDQIFISARSVQDYRHCDCRVLVDLEPGLGPLSGIERALRESISPMVLVCPVDLPKMTSECLHALARCCNRLTGAIATVSGELQPLVAVYPTRCHAYAARNLARGDYAVHRFASACLQEKAIKLFRVPSRMADCFRNCNTPEDLMELGAHQQGGPATQGAIPPARAAASE